MIKSAGVEIRDVRSTLVPVRKELQQNFDLESYIFVPFVLEEVCRRLIIIFFSGKMCFKSFIIIFFTFHQAVSEPLKNIVQIVLENAYESFEVSEVVTSVQQERLVPQILSLANARSSFHVRETY